MPSRSVTPGRNVSTSTSASSTRRPKASRPASDLRSIVTERRERFHTAYPLYARKGSPPGGSIFTTSAPCSARSITPRGPAVPQDRSRIFTPSSAPIGGAASRKPDVRVSEGVADALRGVESADRREARERDAAPALTDDVGVEAVGDVRERDAGLGVRPRDLAAGAVVPERARRVGVAHPAQVRPPVVARDHHAEPAVRRDLRPPIRLVVAHATGGIGEHVG